ncbi:4-alpha-glucanotransferase [Shewanella donghaensis]|uniref:4-alpha-glucanotransferase n=1 Tax=Shewanella donghaensis TaxID=238836 RepID=UPI0011823D04|nr:4-alpha-glucanotransferase [Shewanella donghaensis]
MGLEKLLYLQGVGAEFIDCFGNNVQIQPRDRNGILQSMCSSDCMVDEVKNNSEQAITYDNESSLAGLSDNYIQERIYELDAAPWTLPLQGFQWSYVDNPTTEFYLPANFKGKIRVEICLENGEKFHYQVNLLQMRIVGDYAIDGIQYLKYLHQLNHVINAPIGLGYHAISASFEFDGFSNRFHGQLMIAPREAFTQSVATGSSWGLSTQLYSLQSEKQWGIGDFGDLLSLIDLAAQKGADFILLNPLHALDLPENVSPYSPSDRRRLNPLYIHIDTVEEYSAIKKLFDNDIWNKKKAELARVELLDYNVVYEIKFEIFQLLYQQFLIVNKTSNTERYQQFTQFKQEQGDALIQYVTHQQDHYDKLSKDAHYEYNREYKDIEFLCYLQFVASEQLILCQLTAKSIGMPIGLVRDMAVGASPTGSEVTANTQYFCIDANIGAPPDPFAPQGQNWGLTPFDPIKIAQHRFEHFIDLIRSNMQSCGGLRIDHVMGLLRLWWWPKQQGLGNGAYVYYPLDTLLAILCLESQREQCILIGEDLGIVPPEIRDNLSKAKIFSNELFYFSKHHQGFTEPHLYKSHSLMMLANHDVPTLTAWWHEQDIELRHQLNLYEIEQNYLDAKTLRYQEKQQLISLLKQQQLIAEQTDLQNIIFNQLIIAWLRLSASGCSSLFSVQVDDLVDEPTPINIPGTWKEYPNWRRRLSVTQEQLALDSTVSERLETVNNTRRKQVPTMSCKSPRTVNDL